ncbi:penicillin acylase family protein [Chitinophaga sp. RAB17]|uniref:penicillin acylase family protein n=1 Tax=Chitinophaga sp. RAB17 TaxID=3233049 RepID=UPI003F8E25F7
MKKFRTGSLFPLLTLIILIYALSASLFNLPPLGKLLHPFMGAVQNGNDRRLTDIRFALDKTGLSHTVNIFFDDRKVPHIYADNAEDLYFAQGYVTAYLRLWQMDFITYAAAGRLSELFAKEEFLEYDRNQRRIGILDAARKTLELVEQDPETEHALTAYSRGVNAYIKELSYRQLPLEYKLMDYRPEAWSNLKSVLILKSMANSMTGYGEDLFQSKMMLALGEEDFNKLFPDFNTHSTPVMNLEASAPRASLPRTQKPAYLDYSFLASNAVLTEDGYNPRLGSNSWAVSGMKTKSGRPILANDPHLGLSFPSVWMELQLSAPGMNVYGVAIPGAPAVVIGFNENIAWGITNGADDVKDWYKLKISSDYKKYELDGKWLPLTYRIEEIKRKDQAPFYDTVYSSIHGPIVTNKSFPGRNPDLLDNALKWELHHPSNEFLTFIQLNKARNYDDYKAAIRHYACPLQNFTFACKDNTIAINHQGNMAVKWPGQGKFIMDGTKSDFLYTRYIPADSLPQLYNPVSNFVLSANQHPTNADYPYYYDGYYAETRANRIQQLLEKRNDLDIPAMEAIQLDNTNDFAVQSLPVLIKNTDTTRLNAAQQKIWQMLIAWKGAYNFNDENAKLYELWWKNITAYTWDELNAYPFYTRPPDEYVLLNLVEQQPDSHFFDKQGTVKKENASDIITEAFIAAAGEYGQLKAQGSIRWGDCNKVNIMHLANLPALSKMGLPSAGHPEAINAISSNWGPSWRMIVQLGDRPQAYGIYPGGQSGNAGSSSYDNFTDDWSKGKYYPLQFFMSVAEAKAQTNTCWTLK